MISLGIAVAAGVWEIDYETALRKLAEAKLGIRHLTKEVHRIDHLKENMRARSIVWAEPVGNYFFHSGHGEWMPIQDLPCPVPTNWQGGYFIYGYGPSGFLAKFSRTLPTELVENKTKDHNKPK
jgi:hypothetical protein